MKLVYFLVVILLVQAALADKKKKKSSDDEHKKSKNNKGKGKAMLVPTVQPTCPTCPPQTVTFLRTTVVCEDEGRRLRCPPGTSILITDAFYGRRSRGLCPRGNTENAKCSAQNPIAALKDRCDNRQECDLAAINTWFSDPCPETYKYLDLDFVCQRTQSLRG